MSQPHIVVVTAVEMTVRAFLLGHLRAFSQRYQVTVLTDVLDARVLTEAGAEIAALPVRIPRPISPLADLSALYTLFRHFRRGRFDLVFSVTPKAGLLSMLAGFVAGIPVRMHVFTGQVWATRRGLSRFILKTVDRLTARLATHVLADSESQRQFLIHEGVISATESAVLAQGSICGVDLARFRPDAEARRAVRADLALDEATRILLFLGRLNPEKGVLELAHAFEKIAAAHPEAHLVFVGPDETGMRKQIKQICVASSERLHFVGFTDQPQRYMAAADIFCLPSHREGFGSVVIEAAATSIPSVASRIYGLTDAVVDGQTGLLHEPRDIAAIASCLTALLCDDAYRQTLGAAARERAERDFSAEKVTSAFVAYLVEALEAKP